MYSKPHLSDANEKKSYCGSDVTIAPSKAIPWATLHSVDDRHAYEECTRRRENPVFTVSHDFMVTYEECIYLQEIP